uniref:Uncharacterized protein n=1 Tax=Cannabis sativa TaxID=3483 RepID=A0A803Q620_CANSA
MAEKGKSKGKKSGPSSSDRVIKTRSMDAVLGIQELEVEDADEPMEQYQEPMEQYIEKVFSPEESILEGFVRRLWKDEVVKVGLLAKGIFIIRVQEERRKKEPVKQVWMPKKPTKEEENLIDVEGFQKVSNGKKINTRKESEQTTVRNMFESLSAESGNVEEVGIKMGIAGIGNEMNT